MRLIHEDAAAALSPAEERRVSARLKCQSLAYLAIDGDNGGILSDICAGGIGTQAVTPLRCGHAVQLHLELSHPRLRLDALAEVAWSSPSGHAGLRFTSLSPSAERRLHAWLTTVAGAEASNAFPSRLPHGGQLTLSEASLAAPSCESSQPLSFPSRAALPQSRDERRTVPHLHFSWWPAPVHPAQFSRLVNAGIVLLAVMLFHVVFLLLADDLLPWQPSLLMLVGSAALFAAVFFLWFRLLGIGTPGETLAQAGISEDEEFDMQLEELSALR